MMGQFNGDGKKLYNSYFYPGDDWPTFYSQFRVKDLGEIHNTPKEINAFLRGMMVGYYTGGKVIYDRLKEKGYDDQSWPIIYSTWVWCVDYTMYEHLVQMWNYWVLKNKNVRMSDIIYSHLGSETGLSDEEILRWYKEERRSKVDTTKRR